MPKEILIQQNTETQQCTTIYYNQSHYQQQMEEGHSALKSYSQDLSKLI